MVSLVPGQAQKVWIGAGYPLLRVCIDLQTTGSAVITIDDQQPKTLRPGLCTEDYGSTIEMSNHDAGTATVVYRAIFEPPPP